VAETPAEIYAALVRDTETQRLPEPAERRGTERWGAGAERFREDPFRENETLTALLSFIQPDDKVLDIGGGAGRYLPLALRCREYVNVEPSPGMGAQFQQAVRDANVANATWLHSDWLGADIDGDVCFTANVVYYIGDIVPFVRKLHDVARRRVMIVMHSVPPTNIGADINRAVHGERTSVGRHSDGFPLWRVRQCA
jgi:cyclopropane fatty-acyl-phospholipid synthase-like methyltransferase